MDGFGEPTVGLRQWRRPLRLSLGPGLLPAIALEHAEGASGERIQHRQNHSRFLTAMVARLDWIGIEAGEDFVFELVSHCIACPSTRSLSYKVNRSS
jgi:hypothetical protein